MSLMQSPFNINYSLYNFCAVPSRISIETTTVLYPNLKKLRPEYLCNRCLPWLENDVDDESVHSDDVQVYLYGGYVCIGLLQCSQCNWRMGVPGAVKIECVSLWSICTHQENSAIIILGNLFLKQRGDQRFIVLFAKKMRPPPPSFTEKFSYRARGPRFLGFFFSAYIALSSDGNHW